jgi:hypothetical protein
MQGMVPGIRVIHRDTGIITPVFATIWTETADFALVVLKKEGESP